MSHTLLFLISMAFMTLFYWKVIPMAFAAEAKKVDHRKRIDDAVLMIAAKIDGFNATEATENSMETPDGRIVRFRKVVQIRSH